MNRSYSVAVIIPTYNSARFIRKTVHSVFAQDYEPIEIIVVDDGSEDDTIKTVKNLPRQVRILHHPRHANLKAAQSRNLGIQNTDEDLIAFLDHDDIFYPTKISEQVEIFQNRPEIGLVHTNGHVIDKKNNVLYDLMPKKFYEPNSPVAILLNCYIRTPSAVMVRRNILKQAGMFNTDLGTASDHDLWIRLSEVTKFYYIPNYLLGYREHDRQMSSRREMWEQGFDILERANKRYPYGLKVKRRRLAVLNYRLGMYDLTNRRYRYGIKYLTSAFILDPTRAMKILFKKIGFRFSN